MTLTWLPNALSIARMLLVIPSTLALLAGRYELTLLLFGIAAVSDALDGWLAKRYGWSSRSGKILDPIADKLLLVTLFVTLAWIGRVPVWLAAAVVLRDLLIVGGAVAYRLLIGHVEGHPTPVSKLNTLLQIVFVLVTIAASAWRTVPAALVATLGAATFITTVVSGVDYVLRYGRDALRAGRPGARAR